MFTLLFTACRMFSKNKEILAFRNIFHWYNQSPSDMSIEVIGMMIQVGCLGLIQASQRFEQTKGTVFHVFAKPHIRRENLNYLRDRASQIRFPRHIEERSLLLKEENEQTFSAADQLIRMSYRYKTT